MKTAFNAYVHFKELSEKKAKTEISFKYFIKEKYSSE